MYPFKCLGCEFGVSLFMDTLVQDWILICHVCGYPHIFDNGLRSVNEGDLAIAAPNIRAAIAYAMREAPLSPDVRSKLYEMINP